MEGRKDEGQREGRKGDGIDGNSHIFLPSGWNDVLIDGPKYKWHFIREHGNLYTVTFPPTIRFLASALFIIIVSM